MEVRPTGTLSATLRTTMMNYTNASTQCKLCWWRRRSKNSDRRVWACLVWTENEGDRYLKRRRESFHDLSIGGCGIHSSSSCEVVLWNHLTHLDSSKHSPVSSSWPSISYVIHPNKLLFLLKNYFELNKCTQNSLVDLIPTEPSKTQTRYYFWSNLSKFQGPRALTCGSSHSMYLYRRKDTTSVYLRDVLLWGSSSHLGDMGNG